MKPTHNKVYRGYTRQKLVTPCMQNRFLQLRYKIENHQNG